MLSGRASETESFSRPRPPRRSTHRLSPANGDHDDPPPYDSPSHSSSEQSETGSSGRRGPKNRLSTSAALDEELEAEPRDAFMEDFAAGMTGAVAGVGFSVGRPVTPTNGGPSTLYIDTDYHETSAYPSPRREHTGPAATPQRLARLADMNADLQERIDELNDQIQEDTHISTQQVRRLEKELANLRTELSYTQERNEQLEAARRREEAEEETLAKELRQQRTEKLRAARARRFSHGIRTFESMAEMESASSSSPQPRDFAPKATPADFQRILSRAEAEAVDPAELEGQNDGDDEELVESPTSGSTTLADPFSSAGGSKQTSGESLSFMERLTDIEKAALNMQRGNSLGPDSPAQLANASLPPTPRSQFSTLSSRANSISQSSPLNSLSRVAGLGANQRAGSVSSLRPKRGHRMSVQRVALGNKAMLAMSTKASGPPSSSPSKGKARASLTSMSFLPPSADERAASSTMERTLTSTSTTSTLRPRDTDSERQVKRSPSSLFLEAISSPLRDFAFLNPLSPNGSLRSRLGMSSPGAFDNINAPTLKSELSGHELGEDWRAEFEERMFGDLDLSELVEAEGGDDDGDNDGLLGLRRPTGGEAGAPRAPSYNGSLSGAPSSAAMEALSAALDPMRKGELRELDEHILPLGSLRDAPNETFYLLDKAIAARPTVWTDTTPGPASTSGHTLEGGSGHKQLQAGSSSSPTRKQSISSLFPIPITLPSLKIGEDVWNLYPDEDVEEDEGSEDMGALPIESMGAALSMPSTSEIIKSPTIRRERALGRLSQTHSRRVSASFNVNADPPRQRPHRWHRPHRHRHSRRREEPESILQSFAQRIGVPSNFVPEAIPGEEPYHGIQEHDEFDDDETEVEEHAPSHPNNGIASDDDDDDDDDGYTDEDRYTSHDQGIESTSALVHLRHQSSTDQGYDTSDETDRYNTSVIANKIQSTSMQTIVQVWMTVQFVALVVVFVYFAAKRGPTAILSNSKLGGSGQPARVRSSRGGGGMISRRQ